MKRCQELEPEVPDLLTTTAGDRLDPGVPGDLDDLGQQGAVLPLERDDLGGQLTADWSEARWGEAGETESPRLQSSPSSCGEAPV